MIFFIFFLFKFVVYNTFMSLFPNTLPIGKIASTACDPIPFRFQNFFVPLRRNKPPFCIKFDNMEEDFGELPAWCQIASLTSCNSLFPISFFRNSASLPQENKVEYLPRLPW